LSGRKYGISRFVSWFSAVSFDNICPKGGTPIYGSEKNWCFFKVTPKGKRSDARATGRTISSIKQNSVPLGKRQQYARLFVIELLCKERDITLAELLDGEDKEPNSIRVYDEEQVKSLLCKMQKWRIISFIPWVP
jgi:hypothetical protein